MKLAKNKCLINFLTSIVMRPKGSPSAVISKNTFGKLILLVDGFDLEEYENNGENPPVSEHLGEEQYWNCRRVNKRNVVDAITVIPSGFRGYAANRRYNVQREWKLNGDCTQSAAYTAITASQLLPYCAAIRARPPYVKSLLII